MTPLAGHTHAIAITGATGFVGRALVERLRRSGARTRAVTRSSIENSGEIHVLHDIRDGYEWSRALQDCEVAIHLAARVHVMSETAEDPLGKFRKVNVEGTRALLEGARTAGVKRVVFVSTVKVHGERSGPRPITEDDPLSPEDAYAVSKAEAEEFVTQATDLETVIVRPPLVYGPGVGANFLRLLRAVDRGVPLPFGAVRNARSLVALSNLTSLLEVCALHPDAPGQAFFATDGVPLSTPDLIRLMARALGRPARLIPVPPALLRTAARLAGRQEAGGRLLDSLAVDASRARDRLGWHPEVTPEEEMARTVHWYREAQGRRVR